MQARERFAAAIGAGDRDTTDATDLRLDIAAFAIAQCAHPALDIDAACRRLDDLAVTVPAPTFDAIRTTLHQSGFVGNRADYGDPENSFLDAVLERKTGLPITLSVLMIEIGRRLGVAIDGIGMPGHFLVQERDARGEWCDPFDAFALLNDTDVRALFARVHGDVSRFTPEFLAPVAVPMIVARMLANLENGRLASDPVQLTWMCDLHELIPGLSAVEHARLRAVRRSVGARWN